MSRNDYSDSTPRSVGDFLLFALAFLGFAAAAGGVIVSSPGMALTGTVVTLAAVWCLLTSAQAED